jgi:hypothetical protein
MTALRALATLAAAVLIPAGTVLTVAAPASAAGAPADAAIESVTGNGSGCTPDSVTATWDDATEFRVTYDNFVASAGGGSGPLDFRKACNLVVRLTIPDGYSAALVRANALLYANIAAGATATHRTLGYWQGTSAENRFVRTLRGPSDDYWLSSNNVDAASLVYSPCHEQRGLIVTTSLQITRGTSNPAFRSSVEYGTDFGGPNAIYDLVWKPCS